MIFSNILLATVAVAGVINVPIRVGDTANSPHVAEHLAKRSQVLSTKLGAGIRFYEAELEVGTPPQKVYACFDTGSAYLWLPGSNSTQCKKGDCNVEYPGHTDNYNVSQSSSWRYTGPGNNWGSPGNWGNESVSFAGHTLENFSMFVSDDEMWFKHGIFGQSQEDDYTKSFVQGLAHAGQIPRAVFSISSESPLDFRRYVPSAVHDVVSNVYYGGFDTKKYEGPLTTVDLNHRGGYAMPLTDLIIDGKPVKTERKYNVVFDTGADLLFLPNATHKALSLAYGGTGKHYVWGYDVACDAKPSITYKFGHTEIPVDLTAYVFKHGDVCTFQNLVIKKDDEDVLIAGSPFISRALVIYDNDRSQITLGKASFSKDSNVVQLDGDIPGAVNLKDYKP